MSGDQALKDRVKALIVQCARLKVPVSELTDDRPLFDPVKGLGLDSIDVLEVGQQVLQSINTLVDYLKAQGAKA